MALSDGLPQTLRQIRREIREEYLQSHPKPWLVGFSGGKDSTLLAQLVIEVILSVAPEERKRRVYILSNDTLVESPVFQGFVDRTLLQMREGVSALGLRVEVVQTHPEEGDTFWVNLLGRGYPAPNRTFRWCTDRMKIRPTIRFIRERVSEDGEVILLLGVRRAESVARAQRIDNYSEKNRNERLSPHNDVKGCFIYCPIVDLSNEDVWQILLSNPAPWGGHHRDLVTLYRNARGGECPFVLGQNDVPSCGTTSARFGCWTCTVVDKDNSILGLIDAGFEHLEPLSDFRERLKQFSSDPQYRCKVRRNGQPGLGPLTLEARRSLLKELLAIQTETSLPLVTDHEVRLIQDIWVRDHSDALLRDADRLVELAQSSAEAKHQ